MSGLIKLLSVDNYHRNVNQSTDIANPQWDRIERAIHSLDNGNRSSMAVVNMEDEVLAIGGGHPNYHVSLTSGRQSFVLTNGDKDNAEVTLIIGGVETPLPRNFLVDLPAALKGAHSFFTGALDTTESQWLEV